MTAPADRLRRIADAAAGALGDDGAWLAAAITTRLAGRARSLDAALGLSRRGGVSAATRERHGHRDALLREFATTFLGAEPSVSRQAAALAREIVEFETRAWPRLAARRDCPAYLAQTRQGALFALFKAGRVPNSRKQLARILQGTAGHSVGRFGCPAS